MEKIKFLLIVLLTAATIVIVSGCSKDSKSSNPLNPGNGNLGNNNGNQVSVKINGDGFDNISLNVNEGAAYYSTDENATYTSIVIKTNSDTLMILLAASGKQTGEYEWNDIDGAAFLINARSDGYIAYSSSNSGSTNITEYGEVNGFVKGNFAGSVYESIGGESVDIEGTFSIKRIADQ